MDTMVWSMNVIATAKIIAARMRFLGPGRAASLTVMAPPWVSCAFSRQDVA
jgi:hypothetical protein